MAAPMAWMGEGIGGSGISLRDLGRSNLDDTVASFTPGLSLRHGLASPVIDTRLPAREP